MSDLSKEQAMQKLCEVYVAAPGIEGWSYKGLVVPHFMTPKSIADLASLPLDPSDVWIVSYPKAGQTWTQNIVKLIRSKGEKDGVELQHSIPFAECNSEENSFLGKVDYNLPKPRAFKSHLTYDLMPCGKPSTTPCKYIYVARNPKDVVVSYFFHTYRLMIRRDAPFDLKLFFRNYVYGNLLYGDFFDHVLSWWSHRNEDNVLFLMFEDMKKDPRAAITRIATFIGADVSDEVIDKVVAETSFDSMKKDETANFSFVDKYLTATNPDSGAFMRKGEVGDWKNHLTPEQSAEIDQLCEEKLTDAGLVFDFGN
ncbi:LOW QUALITY PROTEIN: amine sulfotransferase-like [Halichondria panicea]|uniref:LOW QUALITY PROTEIN: amine sulfotransferase-like n=1 Tax=Halichondria panicea TaxID=6063 RepID=UPI00312B68FB